MRFTHVLTALLIFAGCATLDLPDTRPITYEFELLSATMNGDPIDAAGFSASDTMFSWQWEPGPTQFGFEVKNEGPTSARLIWDEAAYVAPDGDASRVMHAGIRFIEREAPMPPSTIPSRGNLDDIMAPTDNVRYSRYGGWDSRGLIQPEMVAVTELVSPADAMGQTIRFIVPLDVSGDRREYEFTFEVVGYSNPAEETGGVVQPVPSTAANVAETPTLPAECSDIPPAPTRRANVPMSPAEREIQTRRDSLLAICG